MVNRRKHPLEWLLAKLNQNQKSKVDFLLDDYHTMRENLSHFSQN
jgi:hypothetical protein